MLNVFAVESVFVVESTPVVALKTVLINEFVYSVLLTNEKFLLLQLIVVDAVVGSLIHETAQSLKPTLVDVQAVVGVAQLNEYVYGTVPPVVPTHPFDNMTQLYNPVPFVLPDIPQIG